MKISVLVPTFRRPDDLERCLAALGAQTRRADEVVVVARREDAPTVAALERWIAVKAVHGLRVAWVDEPGQVAANNCGLRAAHGELILITDDDAAPYRDWVERIEAHFARDPQLGGVGGRDLVHERGALLTGDARKVGLLSWYGRVTGNHHIGSGAPRDVQILKGANMAWRRDAIEGLRFDTRLLGAGAQVHNDLAFSLAVHKRGWKLLYDPMVRVDHFPAERADDDKRFVLNASAYFNAAYNYRFVMREHLSGPGRIAFVAFCSLVGTRADPGLARAALLALQGQGWTQSFYKVWISARATWAVFGEADRGRGPAAHHA
ncbi:glycosyltransferase family 2 protein [Pararobbsia silviterrae]|uniref:Glycosyltransferase n=1 Tax=Pararobbsia silviterrae TaxID=1792498 RepID=A0A494X4P7_9BURK|nr:glycosyltransferase [Pararobbsia silviterrae]RKP45322.1 glycosyltransferase [Pararobbsia silviterrae]